MFIFISAVQYKEAAVKFQRIDSVGLTQAHFETSPCRIWRRSIQQKTRIIRASFSDPIPLKRCIIPLQWKDSNDERCRIHACLPAMMVDGLRSRVLSAEEGYTLEPIPAHSRLRWIRLAPIYMSCMACIPLLMAGAILIYRYSFQSTLIAIGTASLIVLVMDWINAAIGADLGLPAARIAGSTFGTGGARFVISPLLALQGWGWYGVQIAIAARALALMLEPIVPGASSNLWIALGSTCLIGVLFALPSIRRSNLVVWTNFVSVIALFALCFWGTILGLQNFGGVPQGISALIGRSGGIEGSLASGVVLLVGTCSAQSVLLSDYSRFSRRVMPDSFLFPLVGIVLIGIIFYLFGATIGLSLVAGEDLNTGLIHIGLPFIGLILVIIAQWNPARVVNLYSFGLAAATMAGVSTRKARLGFTFLTVVIGVILTMIGILDHFELFLRLQAFFFPTIGLMMALDHFTFNRRYWEEKPGFAWKALLSLATGYLVAFLTGGGYAFLLAMFVSNGLYCLLRWKEKPPVGAPDFSRQGKERRLSLSLAISGAGIAGIAPFFLTSPVTELIVILGFLLIAIGFYLPIHLAKVPLVPASTRMGAGLYF
jgi:cytosine permease